MVVVLVFEGHVMRLICGYALLDGSCLEEKRSLSNL